MPKIINLANKSMTYWYISTSRIEASRLSVLVGEYDVNNSRSDGYEVIHVVQHPDFNRYTYDYDIAVLRLADPLPDSLFRPACLPGKIKKLIPTFLIQ